MSTRKDEYAPRNASISGRSRTIRTPWTRNTTAACRRRTCSELRSQKLFRNTKKSCRKSVTYPPVCTGVPGGRILGILSESLTVWKSPFGCCPTADRLQGEIPVLRICVKWKEPFTRPACIPVGPHVRPALTVCWTEISRRTRLDRTSLILASNIHQYSKSFTMVCDSRPVIVGRMLSFFYRANKLERSRNTQVSCELANAGGQSTPHHTTSTCIATQILIRSYADHE